MTSGQERRQVAGQPKMHGLQLRSEPERRARANQIQLSALAGRVVAHDVFAATIAVLAVGAFVTSWRHAPRDE
jgi:hypothetical protein